jgi:hypothetical protein
METKDYKKKIVENMVSHVKKVNFFNLSDKNLGFFLRAFHVNLPLYLMIFMFYGTKVQNIMILFFLFCAAVSFILFKGCLLSKLENNIDGEDITIIDPFLDFFRMEKTTKNRMTISIIIAFLYVSFALIVFHFRFGFSISMDDFVNEYNDTLSLLKKLYAYIFSFLNKKSSVSNERIYNELSL